MIDNSNIICSENTHIKENQEEMENKSFVTRFYDGCSSFARLSDKTLEACRNFFHKKLKKLLFERGKKILNHIKNIR